MRAADPEICLLLPWEQRPRKALRLELGPWVTERSWDLRCLNVTFWQRWVSTSPRTWADLGHRSVSWAGDPSPQHSWKFRGAATHSKCHDIDGRLAQLPAQLRVPTSSSRAEKDQGLPDPQPLACLN